jgi:hypothetical protein
LCTLVEEKDPERAEWLRVELALHSRATEDPAVLERFIELAGRSGSITRTCFSAI